jgi:hypothetical protein
VSDGALRRELPDGGHQFVLEDPVLDRIVIDDRVTLCFGRTEVTVSGLFTFEVDRVGHRLDPGFPDSLAPLLAAYPGSARWLWASPEGELTLVLMQGQRLVVPEAPAPGAWSVGSRSASDGSRSGPPAAVLSPGAVQDGGR